MRPAHVGSAVVVASWLLACSVAQHSPAPPSTPSDPPRLVVISLDGAGDQIVDRMLAGGHMPHLAALAARGASAAWSVSSFPSKTATAHATLWTGCWPAAHGITANTVPLGDLSDGAPLDRGRSGFSSESLLAEPLYITAAKAGRRVAVLSATQAYPEGPHLETLRAAGVPPESYRSVSGFEHEIAPPRAFGPEELAAAGRPSDDWGVPGLGPGARELEVIVGQTPVHLLIHGREVLVRTGSRHPDRATAEARLDAAPADGEDLAAWSPPLPVEGETSAGRRRAHVFFRLFELSDDGSSFLLYQRTVHGLDGALSDDDLAGYLAAYPGFHDDVFDVYVAGGLGPIVRRGGQGGDGTAEERLLEAIAFDARLVGDGFRHAVDTWDPDVLFHYWPVPDTAGHVWIGVLDPASPGYDPLVAERLAPYYERVFELADAWLGEIVEAAGPDAVVAVVSDHGMTGITRGFAVNELMAEAGLLAWDEDGRPDLARTRVLAPGFSTGFYLVANDGRFGGPVGGAAERDEVLEAATAALLAARDPDGPGGVGAPVVRRVFRADEAPGMGIGGPRGGDLYFDLAPGYYPRGGRADAPFTAERSPWASSGQHGFWPERRDMHAIFYLAGPGVPAGLRLSPVRHIDVAPTLAALVGLPAPPCSTGGHGGHALGEVLGEVPGEVPMRQR